MSTIKIGIVDDQKLFREFLADKLNSYDDMVVILKAANGLEMIEQLEAGNEPDLILLDLSMPQKDGFAAAKYLHQRFPAILVLLLSMIDSEYVILPLIREGVNGFLNKNIDPHDLRQAIITTVSNGYYYSQSSSSKMMELLKPGRTHQIKATEMEFDDKERRFLQLAASDMIYKQIGDEMGIGIKQVEKIREDLFIRADVKNRSSLVFFGIKHGLIIVPI